MTTRCEPLVSAVRFPAALVGAGAFLAAHLVEATWWAPWFGAAHEAWFLNSGRAAAFTAACLLVAGIFGAGALQPGESLVRGSNVAAGALVAMAVVLFLIGPGTIFPIVLAFGALIALAAGLGGAIVGWLVRRALARLLAPDRALKE